ncbi:MAG: Xaa-Pro peptidase family protein [Acetobacteraceae bacterium]|nr:Xaa-Pro peptidase family protein [Acetobacteraceae bacterium]
MQAGYAGGDGHMMDTEFLGKPHHYEPRRVFGQSAVDWQDRVDFSRLRRERLARVRQKMREQGLGGLVLFAGDNVRYLTGTFQGNWKYNIFIRYAVLPGDGPPVLFETVGSDLECARIDCPWLERGRIRPAMTWKWAEGAEGRMAEKMASSVVAALKEHGVHRERIGIDVIDMRGMEALSRSGLTLVNAWPVMSAARVIKTPDEIELIKQSTAIADAAFWRIKHEWLKPGVTEAEITSLVNQFLYARGFEVVYDIIVASGGNTSPYRRWHTDKMVRQGDLVIVDISGMGPSGYFCDAVRCFKVADRPTAQEKALYRECLESLQRAMDAVRPGATTADVAAQFPEYDDDRYGSVSLQQFGHSIGLSLYEGMWISRAYSLEYPAPIQANMVLALETYAGKPGLSQTVRLEQDLVVTDSGYELLTLMPLEEDFLAP